LVFCAGLFKLKGQPGFSESGKNSVKNNSKKYLTKIHIRVIFDTPLR
jgi:hypothetical protein